jgi:tRNA pseudouridine55 synthase
MDGILIIDKPEGFTSHDVVARVRRILRTRRVGHTGTLDPFATGVLVMLVGKATRLAQFLDKDEKEYEAVVQFGSVTDTGDRTGKQIGDHLTPQQISRRLKATDWNEVFANFRGEIEQIPPMYSAKKVEGQKLYELARKGISKERRPVKITIHELDLLGRDASSIRIRVACSAGTYIRTLAEDIGRVIGTGAHLSDLRRTRAGRFALGEAISVEALSELEDPKTRLVGIRQAVEHLPEFRLSPDRADKTRNGLSTRINEPSFPENAPIKMTDEAGELIAVGYYDPAEKAVRPKIVLV